MTLKQKYYALVRKGFGYTDDVEPSIVDLCRFAQIVVQADRCCPDTEDEVGSDVLAICKKCVKLNKRSANVSATKLRELLNKSEQPIP